ncbi:hypothetical protein F941_01491 [Acinetobacter bouvetii DSM 14964 = CIP 107468]|uniref:Uncharacterized protein n=1 Tax=Acinetobacter bouvetii DSM 14964 = CIP 107468 TaxID=1120925 RepID=N9DPV1_9GAMM|nr:hypothetical protein F941_01491 [Acinetobacter bouvetii DSM 14964 = CIP 107468]BCU64894.1 hypothetical protein ACBO_16850 [Acinetobacter bouvetii]
MAVFEAILEENNSSFRNYARNSIHQKIAKILVKTWMSSKLIKPDGFYPQPLLPKFGKSLYLDESHLQPFLSSAPNTFANHIQSIAYAHALV